jgi:uncharacterized membrane protein
MLNLIAVGLTALLVLVNLTGLALATQRLARSYAMARSVSPLLLVAPLFCLEHIVGLGALAWLWPITTAASLWLIYSRISDLKANWVTEALFLSGFFYAFAWRFARPNLDASSEKLTDLGFITNYLAGSRLPPVDRWLPPYHFDVYYGFQYYAAALLGRIFGLDAGFTYQLAFCVIVALSVTAAGCAARLLCKRRQWWLLPTAGFLLGGTGISPWISFLREHALISDSMRFIGGSATPGSLNTGLGLWLLDITHVPAKEALELPAETFGYLAYLGDLHPPMAGFYLLALALLCIATAERTDDQTIAPAILAATVPLTLAADAWNFPLQLALVGTWVAYRLCGRRPPNWRACAAGLGAAAVLMLPFLQGFGARSLDYGTRFRLVPAAMHAQPLLALLIFYPLLMVLALSLLGRRKDRLALWLAGLCVVLLAASEFFFVDDVYSGKFERFNTTLKWWPWIMAVGLLAVGSLNLASRSTARRRWTMLALYIPTLFVGDLAMQLILWPSPHMGRMSGDAWLTADRVDKAILEYLRAQPPGIVLQRPARGAFTESPGLTMHAGQTSFLGWPGHENLWRGYRVDIGIRENQVARFYRGELEDSADWLTQNHVDHVLWLRPEGEQPEGSFDRIQLQISGAYYWREFDRQGERRIGVWSRRTP